MTDTAEHSVGTDRWWQTVVVNAERGFRRQVCKVRHSGQSPTPVLATFCLRQEVRLIGANFEQHTSFSTQHHG